MLAHDYDEAGEPDLALRSRISAASCLWSGGDIEQGRQALERLQVQYPAQTTAIAAVMAEPRREYPSGRNKNLTVGGASRMDEPLFPVRPTCSDMPMGTLELEPYREDGTWLFDDPATGLHREPFVGAVNSMLDRLSAAIPDAERGFRLVFSVQPFQGQQATFSWVRADPVEGNWYRADETGEEGWLCPALFCYFPVAPPKLFVGAEPKGARE